MLRHPVPHGDGGPPAQDDGPAGPRPDHLVTFYEHVDFLAASVCPFLLDGLRRGETVVVVATPAHRAAFADTLTDSGHDLARSRRVGRYVELDAATILAELLVDGGLCTARFDAHITRPMTEAATGTRGMRAYGEMVALLWEQGRLDLALEFEDRWNALLEQVPLPLFCGYPLSAFDTPETTARFHDVSARHTRVTTDSYATLDHASAAADGVVMLGARSPGGCPN